MCKCHGLGHRQPHAQDGLQAAAARQDLQTQQSVHGDSCSVWQPAHEEAENQRNGGPDGSPLLPLAPQRASGQPGDDDTVANQEDQAWDHQTHQDQLQVEDCNPEWGIVCWVESPAQSGPFSSLLSPGEYQVRHRQEASREPGTCRERR